MSPAKTAEPIQMLFGLWARVGLRNHVLHEGPDLRMRRGNFEWERAPCCKVQGRSAVRCAKTAEPIEMPFGFWTWMGPRKHVLHRVHIGVTRRIRLNRPCAAAMRPYAKLLWPLVMAALCNMAGHYIFALWFLVLSVYLLFFPRLISAVADWMSTIILHIFGVALVRI